MMQAQQMPNGHHQGQNQVMITVNPKSVFGQGGFPVMHPKMTGFEKLAAVKGIFIKQKFNVMQAVSGCEMTHRHHIYALGENGNHKKGSKLFKCKEKSNCIARQCCTPHCRPFSMNITHKDYQDPSYDNQPFLHLNRPYICTCLCMARPRMDVTGTEVGNLNLIGKVVNPLQCCDLTVNVNDAQGNPIYKVTGSCCQCGVMCEGLCCQGAEFSILDVAGNEVGTMRRIKASIAQNCCMTIANFSLIFPEKATGEQRASLIAATIMMDYLYFEKKHKNNAAEDLAGAI